MCMFGQEYILTLKNTLKLYSRNSIHTQSEFNVVPPQSIIFKYKVNAFR